MNKQTKQNKQTNKIEKTVNKIEKEIEKIEKVEKKIEQKLERIEKRVNKGGAYMQVGRMYQKALSYIRSKQLVTREDVIQFYVGAGKSLTAANASATVLLSPRKVDSERGKFGNCLGNYSADGVNYYMIPTKAVKGQVKKFRFHLCTAEEVVTRQGIEKKRGNGRKVKVVSIEQVKAEVVPEIVPEIVPVEAPNS